MPVDNTPPRSPEAADDLIALYEEDMAEIMNFEQEAASADDEAMGVELDELSENSDPPRDDAVVVFTKHKESVLNCQFHPSQSDVAATGSMDNTAYLWKFQIPAPGEPQAVINEGSIAISHTASESVDCVKFSSDGKLVVTADLDSDITIYNTNTYAKVPAFIQLYNEFLWLEWHPVAPVFIIGTHDYVVMHSVTGNKTKYINTSLNNPHRCGRILPDGKRMILFTACGTLRVFDLAQAKAIKTTKPFPDMQDVNKIDVHKDQSAVLCGCVDGFIFVANPDTGKCVSFSSPVGDKESVEGIAYAKASGGPMLAASGHGNGALRIWDTARQSLRHEKGYDGGITDLLWHPTQYVVFTCHTDGSAAMFDALSGTVLREFFGHRDQCLSLDFKLSSSRGPLLMTTSDDGTARIYLVNENEVTEQAE